MTGAGPGQVLFSFVRYWSRRSATRGAELEQGRLVLVSEAVHALGWRGVTATVNAVAHEVGIDQSGASRLIKSATGAGYLTMEPSALMVADVEHSSRLWGCPRWSRPTAGKRRSSTP